MSENINIHGLSILEELDVKFGSSKSKQQIIQSLENSHMLLHCIPLPNPNVTSEQTKKDFRRERVLLNDVPFIPDNIDQDRCHAFSFTLKMLLGRIVYNRCLIYNIDLYPSASEITDIIMQRACRTSAGADSFFTIQKLLCVEGTFVIQRAFLNDPPIRIDVFITNTDVPIETSNTTTESLEQNANKSTSNTPVSIIGTNSNSVCVNNSTKISPSDHIHNNIFINENKDIATNDELLIECLQVGSLCSRTQVMNCFAIYDLSVIDQLTGVVADDPDPWLEVEAVVVDETNFRTGRHWRRLQLVITCPATGKVYTSVAANMDFMKRYLGGLINGSVFLNELTTWFTNISPLHIKNKSNKSATNSSSNNNNNNNNININERKSVINLNTSSFDNCSSSQASPAPIIPFLPDSPDERLSTINNVNNSTTSYSNNDNNKNNSTTSSNNNTTSNNETIIATNIQSDLPSSTSTKLHDLNDLLSELNQTNISPVSNTSNNRITSTIIHTSSPNLTSNNNTTATTNTTKNDAVLDNNSKISYENNKPRSRRLTKELQELLYS